ASSSSTLGCSSTLCRTFLCEPPTARPNSACTSLMAKECASLTILIFDTSLTLAIVVKWVFVVMSPLQQQISAGFLAYKIHGLESRHVKGRGRIDGSHRAQVNPTISSNGCDHATHTNLARLRNSRLP
ncbi:sensory neuron membrane protein 1, partial [Striga asiatica]